MELYLRTFLWIKQWINMNWTVIDGNEVFVSFYGHICFAGECNFNPFNTILQRHRSWQSPHVLWLQFSLGSFIALSIKTLLKYNSIVGSMYSSELLILLLTWADREQEKYTPTVQGQTCSGLRYVSSCVQHDILYIMHLHLLYCFFCEF